jgi:hypothetical protein
MEKPVYCRCLSDQYACFESMTMLEQAHSQDGIVEVEVSPSACWLARTSVSDQCPKHLLRLCAYRNRSELCFCCITLMYTKEHSLGDELAIFKQLSTSSAQLQAHSIQVMQVC